MNLKDLQQNWDKFGNTDPYWAIITKPGTKGNRWDEEAFFRTGRRRAARTTKKIQSLSPNFDFAKALDFGCGAGRVTQGLADHFRQVVGVDIAPSMIALAKEKNRKSNCYFELNERNDLKRFQSASFDLVFSVITLQHMQPKYAKNYLVEFLRVLKPGGIAIFQLPSKPDTKIRKIACFPLFLYLYRWLIEVRNRTKRAIAEPVMEMYWIAIEEMVPFITQHGGTIVQIEKDDAPGKNWDSYTYFVTK